MRVLVDIVHPAHVHFFRHLIRRLETEGHEVQVVARRKDVTLELLDAYRIPYRVHGHSGRRGLVAQGTELLGRDLTLLRIARRFRPDVILCRNPAGVQVAPLVRATGIFDTDNGRSAGIHFWSAAPFAHVITTPACQREDYGVKHRRYPGYKPLAFLHPDHFTPDPSAFDLLGLTPGDPYYLIRLVAMDASHDRRQSGVDMPTLRKLVSMLDARGRVLMSHEADLPAEFEKYRLRIPAERIHDVLSYAALLVGDSGSMACEAGALGTPNVFYGTFAHHLDYLDDMEARYGLSRSFAPMEADQMLGAVDELTAGPDVREKWHDARDRMLAEVVDVSDWYYRLVRESVDARRATR